MLLLVPTVRAADPSWDCDTTEVASLEAARPWYDAVDKGTTPTAVTTLRAWFETVAAGCAPSDCGNTGDTAAQRVECEVTTCVTDAGDVVAMVSSTVTDAAYLMLSTAATSERRVVTTAAGQRVELLGELDEEWWDDHYSEADATWTATWSGEAPVAGWPADGGFTAGYGWYSDVFGNGWSTGGWQASGCTLTAASTHGGATEYRVDVGGHTGIVTDTVEGCVATAGWSGALDGVAVGLVDVATWAADEDDADRDGYAAGEDDCDDTDPDVNPCAVDVLDDGIDQDCDGADATSYTDTGEVEPMPRAFTGRSGEGAVGCAGVPVWLGVLPFLWRRR